MQDLEAGVKYRWDVWFAPPNKNPWEKVSEGLLVLSFKACKKYGFNNIYPLKDEGNRGFLWWMFGCFTFFGFDGIHFGNISPRHSYQLKFGLVYKSFSQFFRSLVWIFQICESFDMFFLFLPGFSRRFF